MYALHNIFTSHLNIILNVHIIMRFAHAFETGIGIDIWYSISKLLFSYAIVGLLCIGFGHCMLLNILFFLLCVNLTIQNLLATFEFNVSIICSYFGFFLSIIYCILKKKGVTDWCSARCIGSSQRLV